MEVTGQQIVRWRSLVEQTLRRLGMDLTLMTQSYLFRENRFCGVRISCGDVQAEWLFGASKGILYRGGEKLTDLIVDEIPPALERRAAA